MTDIVARLTVALADRYRVERQLGEGGMATVYLARDLKHDRDVAIKVLRPELAATLGAERFLKEVTIAASLSHPHILPLHDSGETDGMLYYVMPFVEGESLRQKIVREGSLSVRDAVRILREVGDALSYAHARGVMHRDVKPDNVMLSGKHASVTDFGVAKALSAATDEGELTTAGIAVGTPAYMAPEQAAADPDIDHRADIYAFGTVAYECLAGTPPFSGPPQAILAAHVTKEPDHVATRREGVPAALADLIMSCLSKNPADRPQHLDDPVALLETVVTPSGGSAKTGSGPGVMAAAPDVPSIAILPFKNMSADPENEYFADGMTEEIINALAQIDGLRVASRTSAFAFKDREVDVRTIGERLNVGTVLEGSVRSAGKRMRVTAQLVKVADGYHLWSQRYDRDMDDVFAVQDEIAAAISGALTSTLNPPRSLATRRAVDVEAYKLYLKGRFHWNKRTNEAMRTAIQLFEQALEHDPTYARAFAGIADCYGLLGWVAFGAMPPREAFPRAEAAARRALEMDETLSEVHNTLGWTRLVYGWDREEAEREFKRAIELNGDYAMAHSWYALHLVWSGRIEEATQESARAMELDPLSLIIQILAAWVLYFAGRYDESIELCRKTLEMDSNYSRAHLGIGLAMEAKGDLEAAIEHFAQGEALSGGSPRFVAALGHAHAITGDRARAEASIQRLNASREWTFVSPSYLASLYAGLNDADRAFAMLQDAFDTRSGALVYLGMDPHFEPLRSDPRFVRLLEEIGLSKGSTDHDGTAV